jgi:hypothetical protein
MRAAAGMQPRSAGGFGLKRARPQSGSPSGTPLLGAGLTADADRRIRQRGSQVEDPASVYTWLGSFVILWVELR